MLETFNLVRNTGTFDSVDSGTRLPLGKVAVIYAENGRGKTTLAAILRSLASGDPLPVTERRRLGAQHPPHIVVARSGGQSIFQNGAWDAPLADIVVFDDEFVAQNVCSGMKIEAGHRHKLHELIIGSRGVTLNATLQGHVDRIEQHNRELQVRAGQIPTNVRNGLPVDDFCALQNRGGLDEAIQEAERALAAGKQAGAIRERGHFVTFTLPRFDMRAIEVLLARDLQGLQADAAAHVRAHIVKLGQGGEEWVGAGMARIAGASIEKDEPVCPFCAQDLSSSELIGHYEAYFSDAYRDLRAAIDEQLAATGATHSGEIQAAFERSVRIVGEDRQFWAKFLEVPEIALDTAAVFRVWKTALQNVQAALTAKQGSPLESLALPDDAKAHVDTYHHICDEVEVLSSAFAAISERIELVKERAAGANVLVLQADLDRLNAVNSRYSAEIAIRCEEYLAEKHAKAITEHARDEARATLNEYRNQVFPTYGNSINDYLRRFSARFRLQNVTSVNTRAGSTCNYAVLINQVPVRLQAEAGEPCFRNTLSAGDRNTLALAFFFASLESEPDRTRRVVVIDDPITSLDEHRSLTTIQELRRLAGDVDQIIVLSHTKPFLCDIWKGTDTTLRSASRIVRAGEGSTFATWDVTQDCVTEHDRNHALVASYIQDGTDDNERAVATALRPILEAFIRVAYPAVFPPGSLLGPFIRLCEQREGTPQKIMPQADRQELRHLLDYANLFHHDTNAAFQTTTINDHELLQFAQRTIVFGRR